MDPLTRILGGITIRIARKADKYLNSDIGIFDKIKSDREEAKVRRQKQELIKKINKRRQELSGKKYCSSCNSYYNKTSKFCGNCGKKLSKLTKKEIELIINRELS